MDRRRALHGLAGVAAAAMTLLAAAPAHAFPDTATVTESFDRSTLGPTWSTGSFAWATSAPTLGSNRIMFPSTTASAHYNTATFGSTQEAYIVKRSPGIIGVTACVTNPGMSGNGFAVIANGDGRLTVAKSANGQRSDLLTGIEAGNITTWDSVGIRVAGGVVHAYARKGTGAWQLAASVADPAAGSCSGYIGVVGQSVSADDFRGSGSAPGPVDTTPPTVSMTLPANGATVSGTVTLAANATDDSGQVASVQFQVDGQDLGAADTAAPWQASWNTAQAVNGTHTVRAVARDAAGNQATSGAVTVTVSNGGVVPSAPEGSAQAFADSIGVNTHYAYLNEVYCGNPTRIRELLAELKIRHIRESVKSVSEIDTRCPGNVSSNPTVKEILAGVAQSDTQAGHAGARTQLVLSTLFRDQTSVSEALARIGTGAADGSVDLLDRARELASAGALQSIEGPNEYDLIEPTAQKWCTWAPCPAGVWSSYTYPWRPKVRSVMENLFTRVGAVADLDDVPVTLASFARGFDQVYPLANGTLREQTDSSRAYLRNDDGTAYNAAAHLDESNSHFYMAGRTPEDQVAGWIGDARALGGGTKPVIVTETGFNDLAGDDRSVSQKAAGIYLPRLLFALRNEGVARTYLYQLADQNSSGTSAFERRWGLVDATLQNPKPVFTSLKRLMHALQDTGGSFTPQPLQYQVSAPAGETVHSSVLARSNGGYDIALWRPVSVWDRTAKADVDPAPITAQLSFPQGFTAQRYVPSAVAPMDTGWSPLSGQPVSISVAGHLVLVRLTPTP